MVVGRLRSLKLTCSHPKMNGRNTIISFSDGLLLVLGRVYFPFWVSMEYLPAFGLNSWPLSFLERFLNVLCTKDVFSLRTDVFLHPAQVCYLDVLACFGWNLALRHRRFEVMGPKNREVQVNGIEIPKSQSTEDRKLKPRIWGKSKYSNRLLPR